MAKRTPPKPEAEAETPVSADELSATAEAVDPISQPEPARDMSEPEVQQEGVVPASTDSPDESSIADIAPETVPTPPAVPSSEPPRQRGGFVATALGGVVAAAAGYALATFAPFPGLTQSGAPPYDAEAAVAAVSARVAALENAPVSDSPYEDRIAALEAAQADLAPTDLAPLNDALAALETRLLAVENRAPVVVNGEGASADVLATIDGLRQEMDQLKTANAQASAEVEALAAEAQARLMEAEAQAARLKEEAEETAGRARTAAAIGRVLAALESGAPFAAALPEIEGAEVPEILTALAESGVPSRAALELAFVPAARTALESARQADMGDGWSERMTAFLQSTTGARSLEPREGADPDAVLSRAEDALRAGDLSRAMAELQGLPPEGLAAMSDWVALAQQRLDAIAATAALSAAIEG